MNTRLQHFYTKYKPLSYDYSHSILCHYIPFCIKFKAAVSLVTSYFFYKNYHDFGMIRRSIGCFFNFNIGIFSDIYKNPKKIPKKWSLEDRWNWLENNKNKVNWGDIEVSTDSLKISYRGGGKTDEDAAAIKSFFYIPKTLNIFYFETKIINIGYNGFIGIGFCKKKTGLNRLPGWESNSFGYHGDDGRIFKSSGTGMRYGPTFMTGDVIGVCWNLSKKIVFFTKNGMSLKVAFFGDCFFSMVTPIIGLRTFGETIKSNFTNSKFEFDVNFYIQKDSIITINKTIRLERSIGFLLFYYTKLAEKKYECKQNVLKFISEFYYFSHFFIILYTIWSVFQCKKFNKFIILLSIKFKKPKEMFYFTYTSGTKCILYSQNLYLKFLHIELISCWYLKFNLLCVADFRYFDMKKKSCSTLVFILTTIKSYKFFFNRKNEKVSHEICKKHFKIHNFFLKIFFTYFSECFLILKYIIYQNFRYSFVKIIVFQVFFAFLKLNIPFF